MKDDDSPLYISVISTIVTVLLGAMAFLIPIAIISLCIKGIIFAFGIA